MDDDARDLERARLMRDDLGCNRGLIVSWEPTPDRLYTARVSRTDGPTAEACGLTRAHAVENAVRALQMVGIGRK